MSILNERLEECVISLVNEVDYDICKELEYSKDDDPDFYKHQIKAMSSIILRHFPELIEVNKEVK